MNLTVNGALLDFTLAVLFLMAYVGYRLWREHRGR